MNLAGARSARALLIAVPVCVAVAWLATRGRTAVPAPPLALWLAAALGALGVGRLCGAPRRRDAALAAAAGLAAAAAHLEPGLVFGHDTLDHLWGAWAWLQAWAGGDLFPLWLHHLGAGLPQPQFYGPLGYWAMAPLALAGLGAPALLAGSFALAGAVSALAAWRAAAVWTRDRGAAVLAAFAWAFAPYRLLDANYRGAFGETWALALLPWVLLGFERLAVRRGPRRVARAAAALAAIALAHPLSLLLLALLLPVLVTLRAEPWRRGAAPLVGAWRRGVCAGLAGLGLAGLFLLPLGVGLGSIDLDAASRTPEAPRYRAEGVHPLQLVERRGWSQLLGSEPESSSLDNTAAEMPLYFGVVGLVALAAGALSRRSAGRPDPLPALAGTGLVALALALAPVARAAPTAGLGDLVQFPWRWLGPASATAALAIALVAARAASRGAPGWRAGVVTLALVLDGAASTGAAIRIAPWQGLASFDSVAPGWRVATEIPPPWPLRVDGWLLPPWRGRGDVGSFGAFREQYTPAVQSLIRSGQSAALSIALAADRGSSLQRLPALPYARLVPDAGGGPIGLPFERRNGTIVVRAGGLSGTLEVAEQAFPGWRVERAGAWEEVGPGPRGLLTARVSPADATIRFVYWRWRPERVAGWALSLMTAVVLAATARRSLVSRACGR